VLEAMARGRSVVASAADGVRESLGDDAGAVVPVDDAEAVGRAVAERLTDPDRAAREGEAGRERAVRLHDVRTNLDAIAALTEEVSAQYGTLDIAPSEPETLTFEPQRQTDAGA
jgi:glycosyltransferase involved in cell wall biosynthesis